MVDRRQFLMAMAPQRRRRPNVLFVLTDEWRAQATRYNGDTNVETPVLDRFAAEAVRHDLAVSGTPVCCPYRASLLTGQYPLTHGVIVNDVELKPKGLTMGEAFTKAGYRTGWIGKWHVYGSPDGNYGRRLAYIPPEKRFGFDYWKACECTHEYNKSLYYQGNDPTPKYWPGYDAFAQTDDACSFIQQQAKAADPYCLVLSLGPPHFPLETAPEPFRKRYRGREIALRENVPANLREKSAEMHRGYYAHMAAVDECLDRLLKTVGDNTIVVFTSDHGDMMLSQGLTTKQYPWDESIRVPFLLRYPEKFGRKGQRIRTPLNSPDILPTLLTLAEIPIPDSVEGEAGGGPAALLTLPIPATETRRHGIAEYRGVRTERYTYVRSIRGPWLLYDNHNDPYQKHNLIGKSEGRPAQAQLDRILNVELRKRNDDFLPAAEWVKRAGVGHYREVNVPIGRHVSPWGDWESTLPQPG